LVKGWTVDEQIQSTANATAIRWFDAKMKQVFAEIEEHYAHYRLSDALMSVYKLIWDDFCAWYLEMIKPQYGKAIDKATYEATVAFFEQLMIIVHPFMPFISEEIWQSISERISGESICNQKYPSVSGFDAQILEEGALITDLITHIRNIRNSKGISPKEAFELYIKTDKSLIYNDFEGIIKKLANISTISFTNTALDNAVTFVIKADEFFVPMKIDTEKEIIALQKELEYVISFKESVLKKLANEKFMASAPAAVLEKERQKLADSEAKINSITAALESLV
jgi:valyl-tRNA synthetase